MALAGVGAAMRITMITSMICIGFGQGTQPLLGYCVDVEMWRRFKQVMRCPILRFFGFSVVVIITCYFFVNQIVSMLLTEAFAFNYMARFARILLCIGLLFGMFYVLSNALQTMGAAIETLIINSSRQRIIYIPSLFPSKVAIGLDGPAQVQPVADILPIGLVAVLYIRAVRKMEYNCPILSGGCQMES